jgi:hypothetical protein
MARGLAVAVVAVLLLAAAAPAQAASGTFTCATIQGGIDQAANGDVITLDSSAAPGGLCPMQVTLKSFPSPVSNYTSWTLTGRTGMNDGFDGSGLPGRVMTGTDVHRLELQDLTFRDSSSASNGGAVAITGESSVGLRLSEFYNNDSAAKGGAVYLSQEPAVLGIPLGGIGVSGNTFGSLTNPAEGNTAVTGGALAIETPGQISNSGINTSTFANNVAEANGGGFDYALDSGGSENFSIDGNVVVDNRAGGSGGGGHVVVANSFLSVDGNTFEGNSVEDVPGIQPAGDHFGGGLYLENGILRLRDNDFRGNSVNTIPGGQDYGGGGLAVFGDGLGIESQFTRFEGNSVAGQASAATGFDSEGGGLFLSSPGARWYAFLDAVAGNSVGAFGEGGGIYTGAAGDTTLELGEVTVAGNSVGAGGQFRALGGGGPDDLIMRNSIVYTGGAGDIGGFDEFNVQFSDACNGGVPFAGPGNICADPLLAGGADVHQTKASPTIDAGSDELFMSEGGERALTDFEGDPRPTDGDGDGDTVDMGADETPAGFSAPPPPPPPPPPATPQCSDTVDNDSDGAIDLADPGCLAGPQDDNEGDETERDLVLCGERVISLVRADARGRRVVLSGLVAASVAGQKVQLSVRFLGGRGKAQKLGSVTPGADGRFQARVKGPSRKLSKFARYRAQVGNARSVELKLPQSLASSSLRAVGGMLELRGQVDRKLLGKRNAVVVKRILCGKYTTVGQAKPNRRGAYVVRFPAPATTGGAALYRAESRVLARPGSKRYVKQFARAIGITF